MKITGGVFTDKGFILGKIFADCNANGVQDRGEPGVPAVRLFLEDGTYVITDGGGKFSFYGVSNRTHVVKVDRSTRWGNPWTAAVFDDPVAEFRACLRRWDAREHLSWWTSAWELLSTILTQSHIGIACHPCHIPAPCRRPSTPPRASRV